jgi:adenylate cyclase
VDGCISTNQNDGVATSQLQSMDDEDMSLDGVQRKRRAVMVVDVVESVREMELDEGGFIRRWRRFVQAVRGGLLAAHRGVLVKSLGDGLLLQFDDPANAVACGFGLLALASEQAVDRLLRLRLGAHVADIVVDDLYIYGTGVNIAARLATLAAPGQIVASAPVRDALADGVHCRITDLGECFLKHVSGTVRAFRLEPAGVIAPPAVPYEDDIAATLAVLPFATASSASGGLAVGEALIDAFNQRLARVPGLRVISRLSTRALAGLSDAVGTCGRYLGADYIVSGTSAGDLQRMHVRCELLDGRDGTILWADEGRVEISDLFAGEDADFDRLVGGLCLALLRTEMRRARRLPLPTLASFTLYVGGVILLHRLRRDDFLRAREVLEALQERHPRAATPPAMLAKWYLLSLLQGWSADPTRERQQALALARQALDLEPDHAAALAIDGLLSVHFGADLAQARQRGEQAVEADPQEPQGWLTLAGVASYEALGDQAVAHAERAIALSPIDPCRFLFDLLRGAGELAAGRPEAAVASAESSLRLNALHAPSYRLLVIARVLAGRLVQAREAAAGLLRVDPGFRVSNFAERYPGRHHAHAASYVQALKDAGLPS